jgi:hypothetical protein
MSRIRILLTTLVALGTLSGCNTIAGQPSIREATIKPNELTPGGTALVTMAISDKHGVVDRVEGVVQEDDRITLKLRDDGEGPDETAGDNVWSLDVEVPPTAPPGEFILELTAFRSDGLPVQIRDKGGNVSTLSATVPLIIRYE